MSYIDSGKADGATCHLGGGRFSSEGYYIEPTIFTDTTPEMKIVKEEIFGPVGVVIKFEDDEGGCLSFTLNPALCVPFPAHPLRPVKETLTRYWCVDVIRMANDTVYGLAAAVFSQNIGRAITATHKLRAGTAWVNCYNVFDPQMPFGGYKQSGIGRELGEYALAKYVIIFSLVF